MFAWWESLGLFEAICLYIAIPATLILLIQLVLLLVGLGGDAGGDADLDADGTDAGLDADGLELDADGLDLDVDGLGLDTDGIDLDADGPDGTLAPEADGPLADGGGGEHSGFLSGLNLLTVRGVVTFLTLFGWGGLWLSQLGLHPLLAAFLAIQMGIVGMVVVALILREALRLQSDGTLDIRNAVGKEGTVYLTIPAARSGMGKVNVLVQEQLREFEAVTDAESPIPTGAAICVAAVAGQGTLLVTPAPPEEAEQQS